jgi:hypothetical protein
MTRLSGGRRPLGGGDGDAGRLRSGGVREPVRDGPHDACITALLGSGLWYHLLKSTVGSFADQPSALLPINRSALLPINRRLFCRSTVGDEHRR